MRIYLYRVAIIESRQVLYVGILARLIDARLYKVFSLD